REQLDQSLMGVDVDDRRPLRGRVLPALPLPKSGETRRGQRADNRGRPPLLGRYWPDAPRGPVPRDRGDRFPVVQYPPRRVADRLGFNGVDVLAQDVAFLVVRLVRVGVDAGIPEPPLASADPSALARLAVLGFADSRALDRAFPPRSQCLH